MNRQAIETRKNIIEALLGLLQEKSLNRITVKEVTDKACISRVAFYYHFSDVYALFDSIQKQAIETIAELLEESLTQGDPSLFERQLFSYAEDNKPLFAVLVGEGLAPSFILEALNAARQAHTKSANHLNSHLRKTNNQVFIDYQFLYMAGGTLFMVFDWIANGCELSSEKIATLAEVFNHQVGSLSFQRKA